MIGSFRDKATQDVFNGVAPAAARKIIASTGSTAGRKLDLINAAQQVGDLRAPPGNKLENIKGNLAGYYGIRINQQFRIIFKFASGSATEVQIVDYH